AMRSPSTASNRAWAKLTNANWKHCSRGALLPPDPKRLDLDCADLDRVGLDCAVRSDFWALGFLAAVGFNADPARAEAPPFFQNKTITITVGVSPGGLYDQTARAIARQLGRHIEGNPAVIVQNKPGAGGTAALTYLLYSAPQDGTAVAMIKR